MLVATRRLVAAVAVVVALLLPQAQVSGADVSSELLTDGIRVRSYAVQLSGLRFEPAACFRARAIDRLIITTLRGGGPCHSRMA